MGSRFSFSRPTLAVVGLYLLPVLLPSLFGWMTAILAVPVAYLFTVEGTEESRLHLAQAMAIVAIGALLSGQVWNLLFFLPLVPLGSGFAQLARRRCSVTVSGAWGIVILCAGWVLFGFLLAMATSVNPYRQLLQMIDAGFAQSLELYSRNSDLSPETLDSITEVISELRRLVPLVMPGLLFNSVVFTAWMNLAIYNGILRRSTEREAPWPPFREWKLPDQLVWLAIVAALLFLAGPGSLKTWGLNLLLVSGLLYVFQGLAVMAYLFDKWQLPPYFRVGIYVLLVLQSYGFLLVALLGLSDIWLSLRQKKDA